jgi:hypothetical protein
VKLERRGAGIAAEVNLPRAVSGEFRWQGQSRPLNPGLSKITV